MDDNYNALKDHNDYLQSDVVSLTNRTNVNSRSNIYFAEDKVLMIYVNRMLLIVYIGIYLALLYSLYSNWQTTGLYMSIAILLVFLVLPYSIDAISKFMHEKFINAMHLLYTGNSFFLYKPPKKTNTL